MKKKLPVLIPNAELGLLSYESQSRRLFAFLMGPFDRFFLKIFLEYTYRIKDREFGFLGYLALLIFTLWTLVPVALIAALYVEEPLVSAVLPRTWSMFVLLAATSVGCLIFCISLTRPYRAKIFALIESRRQRGQFL